MAPVVAVLAHQGCRLVPGPFGLNGTVYLPYAEKMEETASWGMFEIYIWARQSKSHSDNKS